MACRTRAGATRQRGGLRVRPSDERFEGFCQTIAAAGFAVREDLVRRSCHKFEHAFTAVQQLMNMAAPPTAIACINIAQLLGKMAGLKNIGLSVPHDVSVISFDGFHPAEGWTPSITSLHQDIATISARASERLMARIAGDQEPPQTIRVPPRLQIRESCRAL